MAGQGDCLIVTGASQGVGRALALALAARGVNLVLNARGAAALGRVRNRCRAFGAKANALSGGCHQAGVSESLVEEAVALGRFAGFIHAAGVLNPGPYLWELGGEDAANVMDASYTAALNLVRAAIPRLLERGRGLAVFFGSGASQRHVPGIGVYSAAKAAEEFLSRQLAAETSSVTSFVFRPGVVATRMQEQAREAKGGAAHIIRPIFQEYLDTNQLFTPEEAAGALITAMDWDHSRLHGRVIDARDVLHRGVMH